MFHDIGPIVSIAALVNNSKSPEQMPALFGRLTHDRDSSFPFTDMMETTMTLETTPTEFVEGAGTRFAYRRLGAREGTPLVCLQHFSGTMDAWDPQVVNALAETRPVIVFDNTGLGKSSGATPDNVAQMATDAESFISALGLTTVDLLGYSLGGMIAQLLASQHPKLVRKVLLVGTAPQGGEEHLMEVLKEAQSHKEAPDPGFLCSSHHPQPARLQAWPS